jgi:hypothetical protein
MAIKLTAKDNVEAPSTDYPFGNIKDDTGAEDGTPVNKAVYADFHQFFEKLMSVAGLTHNGLPDNATDGFQLYEALLKVFDSEDWDITTLYDNISNRIFFRKDKMGFVHIVGAVSQSGIPLVLPAGYRPSVRQFYPSVCTTSLGDIRLTDWVYIEPSGLITCPSFGIGGGGVAIILVNFSFKHT